MYKDLVKLLGGFGVKHFSKQLAPLKEEIMRSNLSILFELYVGRMLLLALGAFFMSFVFVFTFFTLLGGTILSVFLAAFFIGLAVGFVMLTLYHSYPFHLITTKRNSIEANLPFAINHMSAIAASGVPPFVTFKLIASIHEYGEVANESKRIVRNVESFGMDAVSAMKNVADRSPSGEFKRLMYGIVSTIETGGDLKRYLDNTSKEALFNYRLKREKYMQTLSTYADFYTAVLIAAPLFFVSVLSVMSLIGGEVFGLSIPVAMRLGIYVMIPLMNIMFLAFVHYTQPQV
jgi:flagellar protein FlaJ